MVDTLRKDAEDKKGCCRLAWLKGAFVLYLQILNITLS